MRFYTVGLVATLALVLLLVPLASDAQQVTKVPQVGRLLSVGSPIAGPEPSFEAFRQGLRELGYVEGQNASLRTVMRRGAENGSATWRPNWPGSKWT